MANITITYKITNAQAYSTNDLQNIIKKVVFVIEATDGKNVQRSFFPVELDDYDEKKFIEYENLTKQQIYEWVLEKIDQKQIQALERGLKSILLKKLNQKPKFILQPVTLPD